MSSGDGDNLNMVETVQLFLRDILDQVVNDAVEPEEDIGRNLVHQILDNIILEAMQIVEGKERSNASVNGENKDIIQDTINTCKDTRTTQQDVDQEKFPTTSVTVTYHTDDEGISRCSDIESRQNVNVILHRAEVDGANVTDVKPRCRSSMLEFALYSTPENEESNVDTSTGKVPGEYDSTSGNNLSCLWIDTTISDAPAFTDRLDSSTNNYGQLQGIKSQPSEYVESVVIEKTDAKVRVKANEPKCKVFTKFSKQKKKKTRYGKVKIYYDETLGEDEQNKIVKEAEELLKHVIEEEKEKKKQRKAAEKDKGLGARIRKFFRNLCCCKSSGDD